MSGLDLGSYSGAEDKLINLRLWGCKQYFANVITYQKYASANEFLQTQKRYFHETMGTSNK